MENESNHCRRTLSLIRKGGSISFSHILFLCFVMGTIGKTEGSDDGLTSRASSTSQTNLYPDLRLDKDLFKRYMENPYPIRQVVFDIPAGRPTKNPAKILVFEGSLQDDTFYVRSRDILTQEGGKILPTGQIGRGIELGNLLVSQWKGSTWKWRRCRSNISYLFRFSQSNSRQV